MSERVFSMLDDLDRGGLRRDPSLFPLTQPQFKQPARQVPPRDRYRAPRHDARYDAVEDEDPHRQDAPFDSFDETLLQRPFEDRQRQAAKGQARLSLGPQSSKFFAPSVSSQQHTSHRQREQAAYDSTNVRDAIQPRLLPDLNQYAYGATQPQESSSDGQLGASSSPAFRAGQRRAGNEYPSTSRPAEASYPYEEKEQASFIRYPVPQTPIRVHGHAALPPAISKPISRSNVPIIQGIPLVPVSALPDRLRTVFPHPTFNAVQSKCFENAYGSDSNFVLASPTGSGKTVILELAICRAVVTNTTGQYKIVYQAPTKALCSERQRDWQNKFSQLGLTCVELTGDSEAADLRNVQSANVIVTTPEKWDSITRKWKDHKKLMQLIKLFLIDEVHMLKEDRGATLEVVVSRMKSIGTDVRFVALSATVPNFGDVATWLGKSCAEPYEPAINEKFGEEFRPVRLRKYVRGYASNTSNEFAFDKVLDPQLPDVIKKHSEGKPILVFCFTRNSTVTTAKLLANWWATRHPRDRSWKPPSKSLAILNHELRDCVASGVAFHHAGLENDDRISVEKAYLNGDLSVICCTSTLAVGVNLPCHLVVIKNTVTFAQSSVQEYADLEIMQMLGRAGRPQFDDSAVAVIMTRQSKVKKYEMMVTGKEILESTLHLNLIDHLNAEVGLGTIRDHVSARMWLTSTFLYVRLKQNPTYYKLEGARSGQNIDEQLDDICSRDMTLLRDHSLMTGQEYFQCTEFGDAMARYYVHFHSMRIFMGLQLNASISEILSAIAQASEFASIRFRSGEKVLYKTINKSPYIRFPIPVNLDLPPHKVSLLIQSILGGADITWDGEFSKHRVQYNTDAMIIFKHVNRLIRCIIDCQIVSGDSTSINNALMLDRSLAARVWDDSPLQMKQVEGLGVVGVRKLASAGIRSIEELECTDAHRIDMVLGRNPPFGMGVLNKLKSFPKLRVSLHVLPTPPSKSSEGVKVQVKADIGFINEKPPESFGSKLVYVCLLAETSDARLVHFARISSKKLGKGQALSFPALLACPNLSINCYIMCDGITGTMRSASVTPKVASSLFPSPKRSEPTTPYVPERPTSNMSRRRTETTSATRKPSGSTDEFGDDDIDDETLVKASFHDLDFDHIDNYANPTDNLTRKNTAKNASSKNKSRASSNQNLAEEDEQEPVRLDNGKWACNHKCKDKKACKHLCCKEGVDKPPKKSAAKRVSLNENRVSVGQKGVAERDKKTQGKLQLASSKRKSSAAVEELDLTQQEKKRKTDYARNGPKDHRDLYKLHKSIQRKDPPSTISSIVHQKPAYCYGEGGQHNLSFLGADFGTKRQDSISSDYGDISVEDLSGDLEQPPMKGTQPIPTNAENDAQLQSNMGPPLEDIVDDLDLELFGDDDSVLGDAIIGAAESEDLKAAEADLSEDLQPFEESFDKDYNAGLQGEGLLTRLSASAPHQKNQTLRDQNSTSGMLGVYPEPHRQSRAAILDDPSSPSLTNDGFRSAKSLLEAPARSKLKQASKSSQQARRRPSANEEVNGSKHATYESILTDSPKDVVDNSEDETIPDAYKDLEPWLFKEFGDIVEIVDN